MLEWKQFVLVLLFAGCSAPVLPGTAEFIDQQDVALQIIWQGAYGRTDSTPQIRWVSEEQQNCVDPRSGKRGIETIIGCVEGLTLSPDAVSVSWHDGDRFSGTALAHELVHAAQARRLLYDFDHHTAEFQRGGAVDQANAMLKLDDL